MEIGSQVLSHAIPDGGYSGDTSSDECTGSEIADGVRVITRILITNCHNAHNLGCMHNRGSAAVMGSTIRILRQWIPDVEFATFVQLPEDFAEGYGIRVIRNKLFSSKPFSARTILASWSNLFRCALWRLSHKRFSFIAKVLMNNRELREYADADVVLDVSMDLYSDDFGVISLIEHSKDMLLGVLLKKPVIIWAQSPGPFRSRFTSWLAKLTLNRVALITVREEISLSHLRELGVNIPPIYLTADPAFLLEPATEKRAREILLKEGIDRSARPVVGLTMSWASLMGEAKRSTYLQCMQSAFRIVRILLPEGLFGVVERQASRFKSLNRSNFLNVEAMGEIVDYLVEKLDATVVLIPHDTDPVLDDRIIAREVLERAKRPERVRLITGDHSASELKATIGQCDLFIGGKMHANIAALSMQVPTVAIQYGHKFHGIMGLLGQEEYICDKLAIEEVKSKADQAWCHRESIRLELETSIGIVKERAIYNAKLVAALLKSNGLTNVSSRPFSSESKTLHSRGA